MGIEIVPVPELFALVSADGCCDGDCRTIYVDKDRTDRYEYRYNCTLAHEVGHIEMHREIYEAYGHSGLEGFKAFQLELLDRKLNDRLNYQAFDFAGLVLVPSEHLAERARRAIAENDTKERVERARRANFPPVWLERHLEEVLRSLVAKKLTREFSVSDDVLERRIEKEGLDLLPLHLDL